MADIITLGLTQDKYTNFIVYDESDRTQDEDWIELDKINSVTVTFKDTSPELKHNRLYRFNNTKRGILLPYDEFIPVDCSGYLESKTLTLEVDGISQTIEFTENITTAAIMLRLLQSKFTDLVGYITFVNNGGRIKAHTVSADENSYIKVVSGDILDYLCWNLGIYRGNNIDWNDSSLRQKDFRFQISYEDFGYGEEGEIPETYWNVEFSVVYLNISLVLSTYIENITEFTYKQTEIYRALIFEYISRNFAEFLTVEQRWQTSLELYIQQSVYFDGVYKAYLSAIEIGDVSLAYALLLKILNFKLLNPIQ